MKMASQDKKVENITKNLHHVVTLIIISLASLVKIISFF